MCLIVLAWKTHPDYPLILLANRDESHSRPTKALHAWNTQPVIYAGQDLEAGGTWLGSTANARFAAVTNLRQFAPTTASRSRGELVREFLLSRQTPTDYLDRVRLQAKTYAPFNLLVGNIHSLMYFSHPAENGRLLPAGIYALSNAPLGQNWPKTEESKVAFTRLISRREPDTEALLEMMRQTQVYPADLLPDTGLPLAQEQALSAIFVDLPDYSTRSTSLLTWHRQGEARLLERSYSGLTQWQDRLESFDLKP